MTSRDSDGISATVPDWDREAKRFFEWDPGKSLLAVLRKYQRLGGQRDPWSLFNRALCIVRHRFWEAVSGADIPLNCQIAGGLYMPHPNGIVIHPQADIGPNCLLFQQVTIGAGKGGVPTLAGHVDVGAGAKLLGKISIGAHAAIGANAVVLSDVPALSTAVGIPARIIPPQPTAS